MTTELQKPNVSSSDAWKRVIQKIREKECRYVSKIEIAEKIGMSTVNLNKILNGEYKMTQMDGFLILLDQLTNEEKLEILNK